MNRLKEKATADYIQAFMITTGISCLFSEDSSFPPISKFYPSLFEEEQPQMQDAQLEQIESERAKAFLTHYAIQYNAARKQKQKAGDTPNDDRGIKNYNNSTDNTAE